MQQFKDVDILDTLQQIMMIHTEYHQSDFNEDIKAILTAANSDKLEDKNLLWLSRVHGTHCFYESDVFIKNTFANNAWKYFSEHKSENPIAYAIRITGTEKEKVFGDIYYLDYEQSVSQVKKNAVKADDQILHYEYGNVIMDFGEWFSADEHKVYGKYVGLDYIPNNEEQLKDVLRGVRKERKEYPVVDVESHIEVLMKSAVSNRIINMTPDEKESYIEVMELRLDFSQTESISPFDYAIYKALINERAKEEKHKQKPSIKKQLAEKTNDGNGFQDKQNKSNDLEV